MPPPAPPDDDKRLAVAEFLVIAMLFFADVYGVVPLSKTPFLFAIGWSSLRLRGLRWRDVGFRRPRHWPSALAIGVMAGCGMALLELTITNPLMSRVMGQPPDLSDLAFLLGNPGNFLAMLVVVWVLAAFGEELVYRGYLMNRVANLGDGTRRGAILSVVVVSIVFGASHIDQGITGMLENVIAGFLLGGLYLACGRSLIPPIVAHGLQDTVDLLLIFLGRYPGI